MRPITTVSRPLTYADLTGKGCAHRPLSPPWRRPLSAGWRPPHGSCTRALCTHQRDRGIARYRCRSIRRIVVVCTKKHNHSLCTFSDAGGTRPGPALGGIEMTPAMQLMRRVALLAATAAILVMAILTLARVDNEADLRGTALPLPPLAQLAGIPLAPGHSGGEVPRGNESGSFAPTSTNDLVTPWTPTPGSPWRD